MLDFFRGLWYYTMALNEYALLAQLDRAFGYGPKGQEFESLTARHAKRNTPQKRGVSFCIVCSERELRGVRRSRRAAATGGANCPSLE